MRQVSIFRFPVSEIPIRSNIWTPARGILPNTSTILVYMFFLMMIKIDLGQQTVYEFFSANMLRLHGYQDNITLRGAPYDFRKGPSKF